MNKTSRTVLFVFMIFLSPVIYAQSFDATDESLDYIISAGELTEDEEAWLYEQRFITVGLSFNSFRSHTDNILSFLVKRDENLITAFLEQLFSAVEVGIEFEIFETPSEMEGAFQEKKLDIMIGSFFRDPVPSDRIYGDQVMVSSMAVISREDQQENVFLKDLRDEEVAVLTGGASSWFLENDFPSIRQVEFHDYQTALNALKDEEVTAFVGDLNAVTSVMESYRGYRFVVSQVTEYEINYGLAVRGDWPQMIPILNKIFGALSSEEKNTLFAVVGRMIVDDWTQWLPMIFMGSGAIIILCLILFFTAALNQKLKREVRKKEKIEKNLIKANGELEKSNEAKSQFLANMSHEIRTPMNAILGLTHLALKTDLDTKQKEYLEKINTSADNLLGIINDILDFSKIDAGKLSLDTVPFNLGDVLENLENLFGQSAKENRVSLEISSDKNVPQILKGDPLRLGQVLINMTGNAVKFTEEGWIRIHVSLKERKGDECLLEFHVRDSGIGLTEEQSSGLFQPFTQADGATTRKYGGTGLGLAISRELTEMMDGEIGVDSRFGEGSDFHFSAKFRIAAEDEIIAYSSSTGTDENVVFPGARILLVEDNKINQEVAYEILTDAEIEVELADNGRIAVDMLRDNPNRWDLVLMDILMPEMDGYTATGEIRNTLHLKGLPVIAMTASAMAGDKEKSFEAGMNDYVQKPIDSHKLFGTLQKYLKSQSQPSSGISEVRGSLDSEGSDVDMNKEDLHTDEFVFPEDLPGIDMEVGKLRMGNKDALYGRMLVKFFRDERDWVMRFSNALKERDSELAERMAHSMKSVAGNLGMETVSTEAAKLETMIREHPLMCWVISPIRIGKELTVVFEGIEPHIRSVKKKKSRKPKSSKEDNQKLIESLKELIPHMEMRRQRSCKKLLDSISELNFDDAYVPGMLELDSMIRKYKYEEAAEMAYKMLKLMEEEGDA